MKLIKMMVLLSMTTVAFAAEVPQGKQVDCSCPSKTCPNYDSVVCAHNTDRAPLDNKLKTAASKGKTKATGKSE